MLRQFYQRVLGITDEALIEELISCSRVRRLNKGELLVREGEVQQQIPLLVSGIFRGYYFDEDGTEYTECFCVQPGYPLLGNSDIYSNQPSPVSIEAAVPCSCVEVEKKEVIRLEAEYPQMNQLGRDVMAKFIQRYREGEDMKRVPAGRRYEWFCEKYAPVLNKNLDKFIASYLGISPEHLSRIKKKKRG